MTTKAPMKTGYEHSCQIPKSACCIRRKSSRAGYFGKWMKRSVTRLEGRNAQASKRQRARPAVVG